MNDIFYLSTRRINFKNININFINVKYCSENFIQIEYENNLYSFMKMNLDEFTEDLDIKFIVENNIIEIICIIHHSNNLQDLIKIMYEVLNNYGGFLGNDSIGFLPIFNLTNIKSFSYF